MESVNETKARDVHDEFRNLVERCLAGEQPAIVELVERYRGQVFGLCFRMMGHRQDAEDMVQETLVRAIRSLRNWDNQREFEPWLLSIAGNRCRTLLAMRKKRPLNNPQLDLIADDSPDLQAAGQLAEEVHLGLGLVRDDYRRAFLLFHEQELSYDQISDVLDVPLGTVKTWVHRARRELIEHLQKRGVVREERHAMRRI
jgi:RNA polymerase sigma-70 factor (ECF subfamily)